jgi:GT2 family glycosyltransferase
LNKKIFVIIVTYNGAKWIEKCILSVLSSTIPVSIIAVDNASSDNSVELLKNFKTLHIIESKTNLGFGRANNLALEYIQSQTFDYVFLLNQDTWIFENTIQNLIEVAQKNANFGILSPMQFSGDGINLDVNFKTYYNRFIEKLEIPKLIVVPFVNAAAWLISKKCIEKVGKFEPLFSHYGEDRNYCDRVFFHNFKIGITENSKICHDRKIHRSFKKDSIQSKYKLLSQVLDINFSIQSGYKNAFKSVFGLPKYFKKSFGFLKISKLFFKLLFHYIALVFSIQKIREVRKSYE